LPLLSRRQLLLALCLEKKGSRNTDKLHLQELILLVIIEKELKPLQKAEIIRINIDLIIKAIEGAVTHIITGAEDLSTKKAIQGISQRDALFLTYATKE
jgi:hypothetical protein